MIRIYNATELSIGQLYMYIDLQPRLDRGICIKIEEDKATFRQMGSGNIQTIRFVNWNNTKAVICTYDAGVFRKYKLLLEEQARERQNLLNGKYVYIEEVNKERVKKNIFKRMLNKFKNKE